MKKKFLKIGFLFIICLISNQIYCQELSNDEKMLLAKIMDSIKINNSKVHVTSIETILQNNSNSNVATFKVQPNLNQITTNLVTGTVLYLDERVKEEITTLMFEKFGKYLNQEDFKKFEALFPNLMKSVNTIGDNLFNYKLYLPSLQQAMQEDIKNIPMTMINFFDKLKMCPKEKVLSVEFVIASNRLLNGESYFKVLSDLHIKLKEAGLINEDQYRISQGINIYLNDAIEKRSVFVETYLNCFDNYEKDSKYLTQGYMNAISQLSMVKKDTQNCREYYMTLTNLLRSIPNQSDNLTKAINSFDDLLNAFFDIRQNQFPMAMVRIMSFMDRYDGVKDKSKYQPVIKTLLFIANLATAKDAEEIAGILKNTALPVGSYRLKRKEGGYVFINSYVGFKYQNEIYKENKNKSSPSYGLSGPIGVSFGICKYFGVFASIFDVGQYFTFTSNKDFEDFPAITLYNIFSPGIFLELNIPGLFLTAAGGYAFGPWERTTITTGLGSIARGYQFNVKIDMPLYTLHRKQVF